MTVRRNRRQAGSIGLGSLLALALTAHSPSAAPQQSLAAGERPIFSQPTLIDHAYWPFVVGRVTVAEESAATPGERTVRTYTSRTRVLDWRGTPVECCVLHEETFEGGRSVSWSDTLIAQADDGTVYTFGELSAGDDETDDSDVNDDEDDGWVVGGELPNVAKSIVRVPDPLVRLPATLEVGASWLVEVPPLGSETGRVLRTGVSLRTPAGEFRDCVQVLEVPARGHEFEVSWFGAGVGWLQTTSRDESERAVLLAREVSSVRGRVLPLAGRELVRLELCVGADAPIADLRIVDGLGCDLTPLFERESLRVADAHATGGVPTYVYGRTLPVQRSTGLLRSRGLRLLARARDHGRPLYAEVRFDSASAGLEDAAPELLPREVR